MYCTKSQAAFIYLVSNFILMCTIDVYIVLCLCVRHYNVGSAEGNNVAPAVALKSILKVVLVCILQFGVSLLVFGSWLCDSVCSIKFL